MKRFAKMVTLSLSTLLAGSALFAQSTPQLTATTNPADSAANDTLDRMLKPASQAPVPLQPVNFPVQTNAETKSAMGPGAATQPTVREGTFLVDRTGRLSKSSDGQQAIFTFDADARAMQDPPIVILPNLKLELMEQAKGQSNRDLRFRVTGMLTEYRTHNYLLLEKVVVIPDVVQQF